MLRAAEKTGLTSRLSTALTPWRRLLATHDPGKISADLAVAVASGGYCLDDLNQLRADPSVFGPVASDPTVSRRSRHWPPTPRQHRRRSISRAYAWRHVGSAAPNHGHTVDDPVIIDIDATPVTAHSENEYATPTYKRASGFTRCVRSSTTARPVPVKLWPSSCGPVIGANTAADHNYIVNQALAQLLQVNTYRPGKKALVRTDSAGGTHEFLNHLHSRRLAYSLGFGLTDTIAAAIDRPQAWTPAYNDDGVERDRVWVAELTGVLDLSGWPAGTPVMGLGPGLWTLEIPQSCGRTREDPGHVEEEFSRAVSGGCGGLV